MKEAIFCFFGYVLLIICVIGVIFGFIVLIVKIETKFNTEHPCIKSHEEIRQRMPYSYVSGNIAIPLGDIETEKVIICDERK